MKEHEEHDAKQLRTVAQEQTEAAKTCSGNTAPQDNPPTSWVQLLCLALPAHRPVIVDLNCGNGHLLRGASNESTRLLLGCDIEPVSNTNTSSAKFTSVDLTKFYPLLRAVKWQADLFVLNPPSGVFWHRDRLRKLADSDCPSVRLAFDCVEPGFPSDKIDSIIATLLIALDRCTAHGEGFLIGNNAILERLIFAPDAPYSALAQHCWARILDLSRVNAVALTRIRGAIGVAGETAELACLNAARQEGDPNETGVIYFAREHTGGPRTIHTDLSTLTDQLSTIRSYRLGASIRGIYACCDQTLPCWQIAKERINGSQFHLLSGGSPLRGCYTLTLGPGIVRYFTVWDFLEANIEDVIAHLRSLSDRPEIGVPQSRVRPVDFLWFEMFISPIPDKLVELDLDEIDSLLQGETWDVRLRAHHKVGRFSFTKAVPSWIYCCFHRLLQLKEFAFDECLNAWIKEAVGREDIINSYVNSPDHLVAERLVFAKTPFVTERLGTLERKAAEMQTEMQMEILRRSKFDCFVYLMEDLRNKTFKIGRSATPGKRERTLQSEVPQMVMRFSIPAEEMQEKQLHDHFQSKRLRGEWFALTNDDLLWIVEFLKASGDSSRAIVDYQWLGVIQFSSTSILPPK